MCHNWTNNFYEWTTFFVINMICVSDNQEVIKLLRGKMEGNTWSSKKESLRLAILILTLLTGHIFIPQSLSLHFRFSCSNLLLVVFPSDTLFHSFKKKWREHCRSICLCGDNNYHKDFSFSLSTCKKWIKLNTLFFFFFSCFFFFFQKPW